MDLHHPAFIAFDQALNRLTAGAAARMPNVKAPPNLEAMTLKYGEDMRLHGVQCAVDARSRHPEHDNLGGNTPDFEPVREEIERLQCAEFDRDQVLDATTDVLLVLSRLQGVIAAMGTAEVEAVEKFRKAVAEAQSS